MSTFDILCYLVFVLSAIPFLVSFFNNRFLPILRCQENDEDSNGDPPCLVSLLVPARNEEDRLVRCLDSLTSQQYSNLEILVLDDQSTDRTPEIVDDFVKIDARVKLITGRDIPSGWVGKHWACSQLAKIAKGDYILFVDADTILSQGAISASLRLARRKKSDLLTLIPKREALCLAEKFMFPFIDWVIFGWLPMKIAHSLRNPYLSATFGQFMLFKRSAYESCGGHEGIKDNAIDDLELGRVIKRSGFRWVLLDGSEAVESLAYGGGLDAIKGISRSIFPALNYRVSILLALSTVLMGVALLPIGHLVDIAFLEARARLVSVVCLMSVSMVGVSWLTVCRRFNHGFSTVLLFPFCVTVVVVVAYYSMCASILRFESWKGRDITRKKIRI